MCTDLGPDVVDTDAVATALGVVHRRVSGPEQFGRGMTMLPVDRRADADPDEPRDPVDVDRADQRLPQPVRDRRHVIGLPQPSQDDRELVAAQPGCSVVLECVRVQASPDLLEHEITLVVAECVVDLLEPVQVEHQDRDPIPARVIRSGHRSVQAPLRVPSGSPSP